MIVMDGRFTEEELAIAKSVDLCAVAESLGYTVKRIGKYAFADVPNIVYHGKAKGSPWDAKSVSI